MVRPRTDARRNERTSGTAPSPAIILALATVLAAALPIAAQASPVALTAADVRELVTRPDCGGIDAGTAEGAALRERMVAKFRQESGMRGTDLVHPFAIRDETLGAAVRPVPATYEGAVAEAMGRLARGHVIGIGLGQVTGVKNLLADFGVSDVADAVRLAFQPCAAVRAAVRHYAADLRHAMRLLDCASAAYNAGPARTCQDTGYVRSVRALQAALPPVNGAAPARPAPLVLVPEPPAPPPCAPAWDAWALAECTARQPPPARSPQSDPSTPTATAGNPDADPSLPAAR